MVSDLGLSTSCTRIAQISTDKIDAIYMIGEGRCKHIIFYRKGRKVRKGYAGGFALEEFIVSGG